MPISLASKQLNIVHAEDDVRTYETCREGIKKIFYRNALPEPNIQHTSYGNAIHRIINEMFQNGEVCDILLMDLNLEDRDDVDGFRIIEAIAKSSPHTKIIVLSGCIHDPSYQEKLREFREKGVIADFFVTSDLETWCTYLISLIQKKKVGILQFSDLHLSCENGDGSRQILNGFANYFQEEVDLLIFNGDISNTGKMKEFQQASTLLMELCDKRRIRNCFFVPGNHDIVRESPARIAFGNFLSFKRLMSDYVQEHELDELSAYPDSDQYADHICTISVYPALRTIVAGLNSAVTVKDSKFKYSYGEVTAHQLGIFEAILKEAKKNYPNYLTICTMHHNIFEAPQYFDRKNLEDDIRWIPPVKNQGLILQKCFANGVNILMSGHSHLSSVNTLKCYDDQRSVPLHLISTGIFSDKGFLPLEPHLTVNCLTYEIDMIGNVADVRLIPYKLNLKDGQWTKERQVALNIFQ